MTKKLAQMATGSILLLSLNQLSLDPENARKTGENKAAEDMVASIEDKGLLQPLSVIPNPEAENTYIVKIGNRRLTALFAIAEKGTLDRDAAIIRTQLIEGTENQILEAQISENMIRKAMNPVDEFEAFAKLAEQGEAPEDISKRFGTPIRTIKKRLALGSCAQTIRDALRAETLSIDAATAYAGCPDQERQVRVFNAFKERGYGGNDYHSVRSALKEERISTDDGIGKFINQDEYIKRGGQIESDLIREDGIFLNTELVYELRDEQLKAEMEKMSEDGWKFVQVHEQGYSYWNDYRKLSGDVSPLTEEQVDQLNKAEVALDNLNEEVQKTDEDWTDEQIAKSDELETLIDDLSGRENTFSEELKGKCGVFVTLNREGEISHMLGMINRAEENAEAANTDSGAKNDNPAPAARFSQSLEADLGKYRGLAISAAMVDNPEVAAELMVFSNLFSMFGGAHSTGNKTSSTDALPFGELIGRETMIGDKLLVKTDSKVKDEIFVSSDIYGSWLRFQKLTKLQRAALTAYALAKSVNSPGIRDNFMTEVTADMDVSLRDYWTPTADNYFNRIRKPAILEAIVDMVGDETAISITSNMSLKKSEAAKLAGDIVSGKYPTQADRKAIIDAWLPDELEFIKNPEAKTERKALKKAA